MTRSMSWISQGGSGSDRPDVTLKVIATVSSCLVSLSTLKSIVADCCRYRFLCEHIRSKEHTASKEGAVGFTRVSNVDIAHFRALSTLDDGLANF